MIERMILTASDDVAAACQEAHAKLVTDAGRDWVLALDTDT